MATEVVDGSPDSKLDDGSRTARGRRGRRGTVCAVPVKLEEGWKPMVVPKTQEVKDRIREIISGNILFSSLDSRELGVIIDAMEEKKVPGDTTIIRQGEEGDFFYVLERGHCDIFVNGVGKVMDVTPGKSFGELALMYNAPRAATVVATVDSTLWALDQLTFKKTLMDATMKKRSRHENFISRVPLLSSLNHYERLTVADALQSVAFAAGQVIIREGDEGDMFYLIESGQVKCTKSGVAGEVSRRLTIGDYFGERALLTDENRAATVTAVVETECVVLDRKTFKRLLGPLEDIMRHNMEVYNQYKDSIPQERNSKVPESDDEDDDEA